MNQLEHANITVPDVDAAIRFIQLIAPDFKIRKDDISEIGYRWVHLGNDHSYLALQAMHPGHTGEKPSEGYINFGVNHLCMRVSDAAGVEKRLLAAGYRQNGPMIRDSHRIRLYFYDDMDFEWEIVEYTVTDPALMYLYE